MNLLPGNPRDRRALFILVIAVLAFVGYNPVIKPLFAGYGELRAEVEMQRKSLATELGLLQNQGRYPIVFAQADSSLRSVMPRLFSEQDDVLATVALQKYIDQVARSSSVLVTKSENQAALVSRDGLKTLRVEIQAESDLEGTLKFLSGLESGPRLLQVQRIDLRPGPSQSDIEQNREALLISATVVGFGLDTAVARGLAPSPVAPQRGRSGAASRGGARGRAGSAPGAARGQSISTPPRRGGGAQ